LQYELDEKMEIFVAQNQCFKTFLKKKCKMQATKRLFFHHKDIEKNFFIFVG